MRVAALRHDDLDVVEQPLSGRREIEIVPVDREAVVERHASTREMASAGAGAGLEQHCLEHAELHDLARHSVDLDEIARTDAVGPHEDEPADERDDEILQ